MVRAPYKKNLITSNHINTSMICENCNNHHEGLYGSGRFCNAKCARGFSTKNNRKEISEKISKSLTKPTVMKPCPACGHFFTGRNRKKFCSINCSTKFYMNTPSAKLRLREQARINNFGGHTSKVKLYYETTNGDVIYLQSSYEVQVAEELDKNNVNWHRPPHLIWVDSEGISHRYYPDFYLIDYDVYIDTKNDYLIKKDQVKINSVKKQNNIDLEIIDKNNLTWKKIKNIISL